MEQDKKIYADEGYCFGLGLFETIAVEKGRPVFLEEHLKRMEDGMEFMGIRQKVEKREILSYLADSPAELSKHGGLRITVSDRNCLFSLRANTYTEEQYERGFVMGFSDICRNETSPFTYHKTLNYGDCIMEKRRAHALGMDELVFRNTKGQLCEGCTTNLFFAQKGMVTAIPVSCGLLPGIMRHFVCEQAKRGGFFAGERILYPEDIEAFDECFVTNSLLGIMPVARLGKITFRVRTAGKRLQKSYLRFSEDF